MIFKVHLTGQAKKDLINITEHIAIKLKEPIIAKNQEKRLKMAILSLDFMPKRHPIVLTSIRFNVEIRKYPVDNFNIFYSVDDNNNIVYVLRILYGKTNITGIIFNSCDC